MSSGIITAAWRGFGIEKGDDFFEIRLGYISFAIIEGTFWEHHANLRKEAFKLITENQKLKRKLEELKVK